MQMDRNKMHSHSSPFFFLPFYPHKVYTRELRKLGYSDSAVTFIAGGLSANTFWLGCFPTGICLWLICKLYPDYMTKWHRSLTLCFKDVVKNRYMTQPDVNPPRFPTVRSVAKFVYQTEGLKGFYRGNAYDICQC